MRKKNYQNRDNVLSFGPRFSWRQNLQDMKSRTDEVVSMAVVVTDISDSVPVDELRIMMLRSGPNVNRGVVCNPYLDDAGDFKIGGEKVLYTIDNRCPPKGKAQAYRLGKVNPDKVYKKNLQGTTVEITDRYLRAKTSGSFHIRLADGWVQLVVGKFHPYSGDGGRVKTDMPDVAYAFDAEELMGDEPGITLNVADDIVSKIRREIRKNKPSVLGKIMEYAAVTVGTPLATLNRAVRVATGQPFFDSFPGDDASSDRIGKSRPETLDEAEVLNAMSRIHNRGERGEAENWKFNILLKNAATGELQPHQDFRVEGAPEIASAGPDNPILYLDCSSFSPFWVKMRKGYAAILPPLKSVSTLYMNDIVVSFDMTVKPVVEKIEPIKPIVTA